MGNANNCNHDEKGKTTKIGPIRIGEELVWYKLKSCSKCGLNMSRTVTKRIKPN